jgi:thymidylate synthase
MYGEEKIGRNGSTTSITGETFRHDMRKGFPILTIREMSLQNAITELRFFIQGFTHKSWLKERGNKFWNKWCNRQSEEYAHNIQYLTPSKASLITDDLGPIYGSQWRSFGGIGGIDQLKGVIETLKVAPLSRRMLVSAWNPNEIESMALPPCHDSFQFISNGLDLDLIWRQRSCDVAVGLPYDILLYGLLLSLVSRHVGMVPRYLIGQLGDTHIYDVNLAQLESVAQRRPNILPELIFGKLEKDLFAWVESDLCAEDWSLLNYNPHPKSVFQVVE